MIELRENNQIPEEPPTTLPPAIKDIEIAAAS